MSKEKQETWDFGKKTHEQQTCEFEDESQKKKNTPVHCLGDMVSE